MWRKVFKNLVTRITSTAIESFWSSKNFYLCKLVIENHHSMLYLATWLIAISSMVSTLDYVVNGSYFKCKVVNIHCPWLNTILQLILLYSRLYKYYFIMWYAYKMAQYIAKGLAEEKFVSCSCILKSDVHLIFYLNIQEIL